MGAIASQITSLTIDFSTVYPDTDQRKFQSSASLAFVQGIHRGPVNSPHKWPVTRKMFPFDDVIMWYWDSIILGLYNACWLPDPLRNRTIDSDDKEYVNMLVLVSRRWRFANPRSFNMKWWHGMLIYVSYCFEIIQHVYNQDVLFVVSDHIMQGYFIGT